MLVVRDVLQFAFELRSADMKNESKREAAQDFLDRVGVSLPDSSFLHAVSRCPKLSFSPIASLFQPSSNSLITDDYVVKHESKIEVASVDWRLGLVAFVSASSLS